MFNNNNNNNNISTALLTGFNVITKIPLYVCYCSL